jgi:hypothetical protein
MRKYIEGIEKILGISLKRENILNYDFKQNKLEQLVAFADQQAQASPPVFKESELISFMSLPDLLSLNFRSYSGGDLKGHWPSNRELFNNIMYHDRVILHDHLKHYAQSSISGYIVGQQYKGIVNWLSALADWRELILREIICVLPQNLSYSQSIKEIWDEALTEFSSEILCDFDVIALQEINAGYPDECLMEINQVQYLLADLSIPEKITKHSIPYLNETSSVEHYQKAVNSFLNIAGNEFKVGKQPGEIDSPNYHNLSKIELPLLSGGDFDFEKISDFRIKDKGFGKIRKGIIGFRQELLINPQKIVSETFLQKQNEWSKLISCAPGFEISQTPLLRLGFFSRLLPGIHAGNRARLNPAYKIVFDLLNNCNTSSANEDMLLHSYFAFLEEKQNL